VDRSTSPGNLLAVGSNELAISTVPYRMERVCRPLIHQSEHLQVLANPLSPLPLSCPLLYTCCAAPVPPSACNTGAPLLPPASSVVLT